MYYFEEEADNGGGYACVGAENIRNLCLLNFPINLKLLQKVFPFLFLAAPHGLQYLNSPTSD